MMLFDHDFLLLHLAGIIEIKVNRLSRNFIDFGNGIDFNFLVRFILVLPPALLGHR